MGVRISSFGSAPADPVPADVVTNPNNITSGQFPVIALGDTLVDSDMGFVKDNVGVAGVYSALGKYTTLNAPGGNAGGCVVERFVTRFDVQVTANGVNNFSIPYAVVGFPANASIAAGSTVYGVLCQVTTTLGNSLGLTTFSVGDSVGAKWVAALSRVAGAGTTSADFIAASWTGPLFYQGANSIRIRANAGNFNGTGAMSIWSIWERMRIV